MKIFESKERNVMNQFMHMICAHYIYYRFNHGRLFIDMYIPENIFQKIYFIILKSYFFCYSF